MAKIYKIQVEINGISTIALIDKREPYSFMTTLFARALNFKVRRPSACKLLYKKIGYIFDKVFTRLFYVEKTYHKTYHDIHWNDTEKCAIPYHQKHDLFTGSTWFVH